MKVKPTVSVQRIEGLIYVILKRGKQSRFLPFDFTEQGVAMLSIGTRYLLRHTVRQSTHTEKRSYGNIRIYRLT
jgi:hypothetical protein